MGLWLGGSSFVGHQSALLGSGFFFVGLAHAALEDSPLFNHFHHLLAHYGDALMQMLAGVSRPI